eukprot:CAMPEP_0206061194 /NCGR_PEP_ID=MMETSP1466-20131121/53487_1 /ASSEMBLY_ACC=CAM_ASM_001126 /TAXON_ID=44452 /ORGANISM="Pavlova gyrans, Strain CCMP608" /LENGTH=56 /DNA_ID=CAMNT_0053436541 /DNA_START=10 /DNA_END=177 /DNA_ORIENTATION=-
MTSSDVRARPSWLQDAHLARAGAGRAHEPGATSAYAACAPACDSRVHRHRGPPGET